MNTNAESRARKEAQIEVHVCPICFCSTPADQAETHAEWHVGRQ